MNAMVNFRSKAFPKYPDEDEELVNSTRWGKRLAEFLRDGLPRFGVQTTGILCEDWGWLISTENESFPLWLGCGPTEDLDEDQVETVVGHSQVDEMTEFMVFITAEPSLVQRLFKRVDTKPALQKVTQALRSLLESTPDISEITWSGDA